jgi:hypothetical protein
MAFAVSGGSTGGHSVWHLAWHEYRSYSPEIGLKLVPACHFIGAKAKPYPHPSPNQLSLPQPP